MSVEFDTPANRIISEFAPKNKFRVDTSLSGSAFLRQMSIQGRLRYLVGSFANTSGTVVFTPPSGETIFIYRYRIQHNAAGSSGFTFINDGETRDVATVDDTDTPIQVDIFDSLVGDGTKTIGISVTSITGTGRVTLLGWSENTSRIRDVTT